MNLHKAEPGGRFWQTTILVISFWIVYTECHRVWLINEKNMIKFHLKGARLQDCFRFRMTLKFKPYKVVTVRDTKFLKYFCRQTVIWVLLRPVLKGAGETSGPWGLSTLCLQVTGAVAVFRFFRLKIWIAL